MPGLPHHITQRGNNHDAVFFTNHDYYTYLKFLKGHAEQYGLKIEAYCLMKNHVHLVATPLKDDSLANAVGRTHLQYTQYINQRIERNGHLWQGRFYSAPLDEGHFWQAIRYIERNPVQAEYVQNAWEYRWSSAAIHVGYSKTDPLIDFNLWQQQSAGMDWQAHLSSPQDKEMVKLLRSKTQTGHPLGCGDFIHRLEVELGRSLQPPQRGRPRKRSNK